MKNILTGAVLTMLFVAGGCNNPYSMIQYDDLKMAAVSGYVTLDGEPLPMAQVLFVGENGTYSYGLTDAGGKYSLRFSSMKEGVTPGRKIVRITTSRGGPEFTAIDSDFKPGEERVPVQYNTESKEIAEVEPDRSQTFNFDLNSGGKKVQSASGEEAGE